MRMGESFKMARAIAMRWRCPPLQKRLVRTRDRSVVIIGRRSPNARQLLSVDRRDLVNFYAAVAPFAIENAGVVIN